jgi:hypothetical protein
MNQLFKLKNTFIEYLSPKRRRTVGPATSPATPTAQHSYVPTSEPKDKKAQAAINGQVNQKYLSPSDTRFAKGSRKRPREDDEYNDDESSEVSPDESISQICPAEKSSQGSVNSTAFEVDKQSDDDESIGDAEEVSAEEKVQEYLDRQAELALRKEAIKEVKAQGTWHSEEIFLFERLSMRSFEELLPATWQVDFPTLPEAVFTVAQEKAFINFNCGSSSRGTSSWYSQFERS